MKPRVSIPLAALVLVLPAIGLSQSGGTKATVEMPPTMAGPLTPAEAAEAVEPRRPYTVRFAKTTDDVGGKIAAALGKIPHVAKVDMSADKGQCGVFLEDGALLARDQVLAALSPIKVDLVGFEMPDWALVRVYTVYPSGGG